MTLQQPQTSTVTPAQLGNKIAQLLDLKGGETLELAKTRDGQIFVKKSEPAVSSATHE